MQIRDGLLIDSKQLAVRILEEFTVDLSDWGSWRFTQLIGERNGGGLPARWDRPHGLAEAEPVGYRLQGTDRRRAGLVIRQVSASNPERHP